MKNEAITYSSLLVNRKWDEILRIFNEFFNNQPGPESLRILNQQWPSEKFELVRWSVDGRRMFDASYRSDRFDLRIWSETSCESQHPTDLEVTIYATATDKVGDPECGCCVQ